MAERIVSPGVFTRERDLSFLPQGISEIGAAIIGPLIKVRHLLQQFLEIFRNLKKCLVVRLNRIIHHTQYSNI